MSMNGRTNLERSGGFAAAASTAVAADAAEIVDDWGQMRSTSPRPGSQEAIRRSAEQADIDLDDVWVQPELYITTRQFRANRSVIGRLPPAAKDTLATGGVCHYLCVYRSERGELYQFDFGPFGGDVHSRLLNDTDAEEKGGKKDRRRDRDSTPGHVRENRLNALPIQGTYLVGRTSMTLEDIRAFNATRDTTYSVNKNDCRHYVNALCLAGTGVENVCSKYIRGEVFGKRILSPVTLYRGDDNADGSEAAEGVESEEAKRRRKARELAVLLPILAVTDLENMPVWDRLGKAWTAALVFGVGVRAVPPAMMAAATWRATRATGAGAKAAQTASAGVGAGIATMGIAAEASGWLMKIAAATQPVAAPLARRAITAAAGVVGGAQEDISAQARRGHERAKRTLANFRSSLTKKGSVEESAVTGRAAAPAVAMGWAGRKLSAEAARRR